MADHPHLRIDAASAGDVPVILDLIRGLAAYEKEPQAVVNSEALLHDALFGERPAAEAAVARWDGEAVAFALWFQTYSTWTGRAGMWLEDLFVQPPYRKRGVGTALLTHLASVCMDRGYSRFEWSVLDWNEPALGFYRGLGAVPMAEWTTHRLDAEALSRLVGGQ